MYKQWLNQVLIELIIQPQGPILVKSSESQASPVRLDMAFVRTLHGGAETVYLPGSSLKGVLRAHCEQIVRGLGSDGNGDEKPRVWSCDPLDDDRSCSKEAGDKSWPAERAYNEACFICRMFGHTNLAGRVRTADAYPVGEVHLESRDGVAINRFYGSVEVGPFTYEVAVGGGFRTRLLARNFTLAQLGLLTLALRDLKRGRVSVGYGKGRGLGRVTARIEKFTVRYPACELRDGKLHLLGHAKPVAGSDQLAGVGAFVVAGLDENYRLSAGDVADLPDGLKMDTDDWKEVWLKLTDEAQIERVWAKTCVPAWRAAAGLKEEANDE
jgi:CRISPR-associated RAMP protein (TIGR02581 family)